MMKKPSPDFPISRKKLSDLTPDARNANKGTARGSAMIRASLRDYGAGRSVLLDKHGAIIAGNKTVENAGALGHKDVIVVQTDGSQLVAVQRTDLDLKDPRARQLAIADNRSGEVSLEWDAETLKGLAGDGIDLAPFWSADELEELWAPESALLTGEDDAPALPKKAVTKPGELWALGDHRLFCGDATKAADLAAVLGGALAHAMWTDPPYNVAIEGRTKDKLKIQGDSMPDSEFRAFMLKAFTAALAVVQPGGCVYVAHVDTWGEQVRAAFREAGFHLASCLIWRKNTLVLGRSDYQWRHEPILYGWRPGGRHKFKGGRRQTTMVEFTAPRAQRMPDGSWQITLGDDTLVIRGTDLTLELAAGTLISEDRPIRSTEHPTMKPVSLVRRLLLNSTSRGDLVLDPFGGSGSTLIACQTMNRRAALLEIDPAYCDVIIERFQDATGKKAVCDGK